MSARRKKTATKKVTRKKTVKKNATKKKASRKLQAAKNVKKKKVASTKTGPTKTTRRGPAKRTAAASPKPQRTRPNPSAEMVTVTIPAIANRAPAQKGFPIVAIGASAGGLEALENFFRSMPHGTGMAFVLVAHLEPTYVSLLPELVQTWTQMKVVPVEDGTRVEPNSVYVIPPNTELGILHRSLQLLEPPHPHGSNLPIDSFFRSLAEDQGSNAVCIILSGAGIDGTLGLKAIKGEVGMVMAQCEESAKYDGMPRSAASTGMVDYVLPPEKMPAQLVKYANHAIAGPEHKIDISQGMISDALQKIFMILRSRTEHDFSLYKKNTIWRRIERRMSVHQIDDIADYVTYLQDSDREAGILFKELLIGVTNFFRDSEAFEKLRSVALPIILKGKPADYTIRAWVPGCSSGEEAYSVAILLHETLEVLKLHFNVQVFGTDIDGSAIELAHAGIYPESITADVSPTRLERYFSREEDGQYRIRKVIREMLVFAPHNIIKDPPFTKLDLLCCRNLLIYLGPELQKKLLPLFHDSLKPDGLLFLGSSESIGQATDLFSPLDKRWKFFQRKASPILTHPALELPISASHGLEEMTNGDERTKRAEEVSALRLVEAILQQSDTPPCVIIDDRSDVIYIHGRTGRFLEPAEGKTSVNVLDMARGGLRAELTASIQRASTLNQEVIVKNVKVQEDDSQIFVDLTIRPILEQSGLRGMLMVIFDQTAGPKKKSADRAVSRGGKSLADLENELQNTQENLQTTIEELETSKEELQSLNEESATVNAELQSRIDDLSRANDDMKNQLDSTDVAAGPDDASNP